MITVHSKSFQKSLLVLCCLLAITRVSFYVLAFPFFCNVDEEAHFDLVVKYSRAELPKKIDRISAESAAIIAQYASPEFFMRKQDYPNLQFPLPNSNPILFGDELSHNRHYWHSIYNHESTGPPLYYMVAGAWLRLGINSGICKFNQLWMLYWIRLLNVLAILVVVLLTYKITQLVLPNQYYAALSASMLVALLPQDTFYSIQNDVFSPLCFGACIYFYLKFSAGNGKLVEALLSGFFLAATVLCKNGNLVLAPFMLLTVGIHFYKQSNKETLVSAKVKYVTFAAATTVVLLFWIARNLYYFGDWSATAEKTRILGWKLKNVSQWLPHDLFTLEGLENWLSELYASFWRGEFTWERERIKNTQTDAIYGLLTFSVTLLFFVRSMYRYIVRKNDGRLFIVAGSWFILLAFIFFLSIRYDFSDCFYPTSDRPYFTSGRLISAGTIPFALMFVSLLYREGMSQKLQLVLFISIAILMLFITWNEYQMSLPAIHSKYNFFSGF